MKEPVNIDKIFEKGIYIDQKFQHTEFDGCTFRNCDFSNSVFSDCSFIDCKFTDCNLSMVKMPGTGLKTVSFVQCKLLGIQFNACDDFLFQAAFTGCVLDYSWFLNKKIPKTRFWDCSLKGVNFSGADLTASDFARCNLEGATFDDTILAGADFSTAYHFRIDPEANVMKKAKFSIDGIRGLLEKYDIRVE